MTVETSVIVLNWNGARLLPACLSALAAQSYRDFDLWLVDNGSIDESRGLLDDLEGTRQPSWLDYPLPSAPHLIRNTYNVGFAAGNNQAISCTPARYVALLNNDAIPEPQWLETLVSTAQSATPSVGMIASTMLFSHRQDTVASAGISVHYDGVALDRGMGMKVTDLAARGNMPVFGPSAGAALYSSALLRDVGLFDERFFSYLEDADLAWRARIRGWKAIHAPSARVSHEYSATGGHNSPFKKTHISRNRVWLLYKNMSEPLIRRFWPQIARYDLLALLYGAATGDRYMIRGRLEGISRLKEFTADRRKITTSARLHPDELVDLLAPALSPRLTLKYRARLNTLLSNPQPLA